MATPKPNSVQPLPGFNSLAWETAILMCPRLGEMSATGGLVPGVIIARCTLNR